MSGRWQEKLELGLASDDDAWLHHEIGYCYLSKRDFLQAKQHGDVALTLARKSGDERWKLNAYLLVAQALGQSVGHGGGSFVQRSSKCKLCWSVGFVEEVL